MTVFNATPLDARRCSMALSKLLILVNQGETIGQMEATGIFMTMSNLWQSDDPVLRRLVYLAIKEMSSFISSISIVTNSLIKSMMEQSDFCSASAIRAVCSIVDASTLKSIEQHMKKAIRDENPVIASVALVSTLHLFRTIPAQHEIREWAPEIRHALFHSPSHLVQFHALALLAKIDSFDSSTFSKISQKIKDNRKKSPIAMCLLIRLAAKLIRQNQGCDNTALYEFLKSCLSSMSSEQVVLETASALFDLTDLASTSRYDLSAAVSYLQIFLSSPNSIHRFAALKILFKAAEKDPTLVAECNADLEILISDSNRTIVAMAIKILLKTNSERMVDRFIDLIQGSQHRSARLFGQDIGSNEDGKGEIPNRTIEIVGPTKLNNDKIEMVSVKAEIRETGELDLNDIGNEMADENLDREMEDKIRRISELINGNFDAESGEICESETSGSVKSYRDARSKKKKGQNVKRVQKKVKKMARDPNAPKRPLSAFMYWLIENRHLLKEEGDEVKDISRKASEAWKVLPDHIKEQYNQKVEQEKERYYAEMKDYKDSGRKAKFEMTQMATPRIKKAKPTKKKI
ncbi:hypothetical protein WR25_04862 [Diploscapter pachys]|uniref:HMG box domain-containing protein n=1 Tax=Diploscapter pachys TaxID=2018661 RepID=A0A2A2LXF4_9BILA|nr:hypothetical protein WR25_04862 [Diploscapter pachys]